MGNNIKKLCSQRGISSSKLSRIIGCSQPGISRFERKDLTKNKTISLLIKISNVLNVSIDELIFDNSIDMREKENNTNEHSS